MQGEKIHVFTHLSHVYSVRDAACTPPIFTVMVKVIKQTLEHVGKSSNISASEIIVNNGGTISHQHGVGKDHARLFSARKRPELGMKITRKSYATHFDPEQTVKSRALYSMMQ